MPRAQVELTSHEYRQLKALARSQGVTVETLIRRGVEEVLAEADGRKRWTKALGVVGAFRDGDGATDVATSHDDYLTRRRSNGSRLR